MSNINNMAKRYQIKPDVLVAHLDEIKSEYEEKTVEYEEYPTTKEYNRSRDRVVKNAKDLSKNLKLAPESMKVHIEDKFFDTNKLFDEDVDFITNFDNLLQELIRVTDRVPLQQFQIVQDEIRYMSRKPEFHRNSLIRSLFSLFSNMSNAQYKEEFIDFIVDACNFMGIDDKGLERKYLDLKARKVL